MFLRMRVEVSPGCFFWLVALLGFAVCIHAAETDNDERLERYLQRLGLVDLRMLQLEKMIEQAGATDQQVSWAQRLSDVYAEQLTRNLDQPQRYADIQQRIQRLLAQVPQAKTPSLEVMLLQAEYQRAEALVNQGQATADPTSSFQQAAAILDRITPTLAAHDRDLWGQTVRLQKKLDEETNLQKIDEGEAELQRLQVIAGRAAYFTGWSHYYRGFLGARDAASDYRAGRDVFRRLLGIDEATRYQDLDAESLGVNSPWRARALIGLGLCEAGVQDVPASRAVFSLLDSTGVPAAIRDQAKYWFFQGLMGGNHRQEALRHAREQITNFSSDATQGKVSFCAAVLRAGARPPGDPTLLDRELVALGTQGLAKLGQSELLRELVLRYGIVSEDSKDFFSLWLRGQQLRERADAEKSGDLYREAIQVLSSALQAPDARNDRVAAERCRVELAWCHYQVGQYPDSARYYQQAAAGLRGKDDAVAVDAGWMWFLANHHRSSMDTDRQVGLRESLEWLRREFPRHELTKRAEFLQLKGSASEGDSERRLASLREISASDPNYVAAQMEICRQLQQRWREATADEKEAARRELGSALDDLLQRESRRLDAIAQLTLLLMRVEVALAGQPPDTGSAATRLQSADALLAKIANMDAELQAEYHYRRLQLARLENDDEQLRAHGEWFLEQGAGTRFELPALVSGAQQIDRLWGEAASDQRPRLAERGLAVYQRLAGLLGHSPQELATNRNAQVAHSKLAHYASQVGRWPVAQEALDRLLAAFPKDKGYLRRAGLAALELRQFDRSLDRWRTLLAGVGGGTEDWYEAKYYQLVCLRELDRPAAERVFRQFRLLDPELGSSTWRSRFSQMEREFGSGAP